MRLRPSLAVLAAMLAVAACRSPVDSPDSTVPAQCQEEAPQVAPQLTDILFVIDNSGSMAEEQEGVATELPAFLEALKQGAGVSQDFQAGVITTSVYQHALVNGVVSLVEYSGQSGRLQAVPQEASDGGSTPGTERILEGNDPELLTKFRKLVRQGTQGSGQETPFEAVRLALTPPLVDLLPQDGGNQGFLRDGARLLVVVVSDEDDCSEATRPPQVTVGPQAGKDYCSEQSTLLGSVDSYYERFRSLTDSTGAQREVLWAVIGPVSRQTKEAQAVVEQGVVRNVDCPTSFQPGYRQREMARRFDSELKNLQSICSPSYRDALVEIAGLASTAQSLEVRNVPDPRLLLVALTRRGGEVQRCTVANEGLRWEEPTAGRPGRVHFQGSCPRRFDDQSVSVELLCAG